jgi:RNA polymerase sigma-70 factor (ECF subfamily)
MFTKINKSRIGEKRANRICVPFYKNKMKRISTLLRWRQISADETLP